MEFWKWETSPSFTVLLIKHNDCIVFYSAWHGPFNVYYVCKRDGDKKSPCHTVKKRYLLDLHDDSTMFLRSMISRFFSPNFSIWSLYVVGSLQCTGWIVVSSFYFFSNSVCLFDAIVLCFWRKTDTVTVNFKRLSYLAAYASFGGQTAGAGGTPSLSYLPSKRCICR